MEEQSHSRSRHNPDSISLSDFEHTICCSRLSFPHVCWRGWKSDNSRGSQSVTLASHRANARKEKPQEPTGRLDRKTRWEKRKTKHCCTAEIDPVSAKIYFLYYFCEYSFECGEIKIVILAVKSGRLIYPKSSINRCNKMQIEIRKIH